MASLDPNKPESPQDIKQQFEKVTNSNTYCWIVLIACLTGIALAFYKHYGVPYTDKFFLLIAILAIGVIINVNQLRKNYLKKKQGLGK